MTHFQVVFEGVVDETPETLRKVKGALIAEAQLSVDQVRKALESHPVTILECNSEMEAAPLVKVLKRAGGKVTLVAPKQSAQRDSEEGEEFEEDEDGFEISFDLDAPSREPIEPPVHEIDFNPDEEDGPGLLPPQSDSVEAADESEDPEPLEAAEESEPEAHTQETEEVQPTPTLQDTAAALSDLTFDDAIAEEAASPELVQPEPEETPAVDITGLSFDEPDEEPASEPIEKEQETAAPSEALGLSFEEEEEVKEEPTRPAAPEPKEDNSADLGLSFEEEEVEAVEPSQPEPSKELSAPSDEMESSLLFETEDTDEEEQPVPQTEDDDESSIEEIGLAFSDISQSEETPSEESETEPSPEPDPQERAEPEEPVEIEETVLEDTEPHDLKKTETAPSEERGVRTEEAEEETKSAAAPAPKEKPQSAPRAGMLEKFRTPQAQWAALIFVILLGANGYLFYSNFADSASSTSIEPEAIDRMINSAAKAAPAKSPEAAEEIEAVESPPLSFREVRGKTETEHGEVHWELLIRGTSIATGSVSFYGTKPRKRTPEELVRDVSPIPWVKRVDLFALKFLPLESGEFKATSQAKAYIERGDERSRHVFASEITAQYDAEEKRLSGVLELSYGPTSEIEADSDPVQWLPKSGLVVSLKESFEAAVTD